jgi:hypothetical protein
MPTGGAVIPMFLAQLHWRKWILRVEAVIFASAEPVSRETLARVVRKDCSIDNDLKAGQSPARFPTLARLGPHVCGGWNRRSIIGLKAFRSLKAAITNGR